MKNLFQYVGLRHLRNRPGRTAFSIAGIACGIALYIAISIINDSTSGYFHDSMAAVSGKATLTASAGEMGFTQELAAGIERVPGVKDAAPIVENRGWISATGESLMVMGVDLLQEKAVRSYKTQGKSLVGDSLTFITHPDSMILTDGFARSHGYKLGDSIELLTARGKRAFKVRAILSPTGLATAYGGALAIMDIDAARLAFGKEGKTDRLDIVTEVGADVNDVARRIRAIVPAGMEVERPEMQSEQMERMVRSFQFMSRFFSSLALIVGVFLISNSVAISIAERRKEIGTLRALGTRRRGILMLFLGESVAMGMVGSIVGAVLGRVLAGTLVDSVTRAMTQQFSYKIEATALKFDLMTIFYAVAIGAAASLLAALGPAVRATRIQPIEAMKHKETGERALTEGWGKFKGRIGLCLLVFSSIASGIANARFNGASHGAIQVALEIFAILGAVLVGPACVLMLVRWARPFAAAIGERGGGMIPRLAIENLLRNPQRTATNVTSLMVGLILVVIIACVNVSFKGTLLSFFGRILHADLIISTTGRLQSHENQPLDETIKPLIEAHPGVLGAYELREIKMSYGDQKILVKYYGEPPVPERGATGRISEGRYPIFDVTDRDSESAGFELFHSKTPTVIVSENFSLHTGKKTGDTIELATPHGMRSFKIIAVAAEYANPFGTVSMARDTYLRLFDDALVSGFAVKLKRGFDPAQVRKELDQTLSRRFKLTILLNRDIREQVGTAIDNSFAYTRSIEIAALLVALLGLMNTLIITVMERKREIGLSRSVGMTRSHVSRMIMIEAAGQGGLGALISIGIGVWLGGVWVTRSLAASLGWVVHFYVPWAALAVTFALGLLVTLVAAGYPARRAAAIEIVEALEYE